MLVKPVKFFPSVFESLLYLFYFAGKHNTAVDIWKVFCVI